MAAGSTRGAGGMRALPFSISQRRQQVQRGQTRRAVGHGRLSRIPSRPIPRPLSVRWSCRLAIILYQPAPMMTSTRNFDKRFWPLLHDHRVHARRRRFRRQLFWAIWLRSTRPTIIGGGGSWTSRPASRQIPRLLGMVAVRQLATSPRSQYRMASWFHRSYQQIHSRGKNRTGRVSQQERLFL
jgi:hypothetical protein